MSRYVSAFVTVLSAILLVSCDTEGIKLVKSEKIYAVQFGYDTDRSDIAGRFDGEVSAEAFVAFTDLESVEKGKKVAGDEYGTFECAPGRYPYPKEDGGKGKFRVKVLPEDVDVRNVSVTSSAPDVLSVTRVVGCDVFVECRSLGETTLSVTVEGPENTVSNEYPISVVGTCKMEFYITPYWLGGLFTRLYARPEELPFDDAGRHIALSYTDSVSVCGVCEFYTWNERTERLVQHVARDTVRIPAESHVALFKSTRKNFIRNASGAIRDLYMKSVRGQKRVLQDGEYVVVDEDYRYKVESVVLDFMLYGADPYIEFEFTTKCDKTVKSYEYDDDGSPVDPDTDGNADYDGTEERRLVESEAPYFTIRLNDFLSPAEKARLEKDFADRLKEYGYDEDALSEEEKERALEEIDKHKKEGE